MKQIHFQEKHPITLVELPNPQAQALALRKT